ncbi:MAG: flagellar basal body-associated protein FliL [Paenibacillaceae bacterium]|nr:flagellar basal body-associated protein FliL [Paenibacillaceae bacterium]
MLKSKLFIFIVAILIAITMILTAAFILYNYLDRSSNPDKAAAAEAKAKPITAEQMKNNTVMIDNITTNLAEPDRFLKVSLAFELDNEKTKIEFTQLDFKVKDIIIRTLADTKADQVQGSKGQSNLISTLMNKINSTVLTTGKLKQIYITDLVLQ